MFKIHAGTGAMYDGRQRLDLIVQDSATRSTFQILVRAVELLEEFVPGAL